jgi:eukaryotic-like serine/threonine-protein kinase
MASDALLNQRYKLLGQLGQGGMAVVHRAQDLSLGRLVAIKMLRQSLIHDQDFLTRFQQEARSAANLSHPNIVTVHDFGHQDDRYYIVMEYIEGKDLKTLIKDGAPFTTERALDLCIQMCAGLGYAHRAGLVHCDVKPQNILVTADGRVKITDFGIARALATLRPGENTDVVWGSPQYYSPEQAAGEHPSPASDVYSIGVVMYEMLAGRLPFVASSQQALTLMHLREEPPQLSLFNAAVPETLERIIHKVLAKEPAARYRTADQLGRILIAYREQGEEWTGAQAMTHAPAAADMPQTPAVPTLSQVSQTAQPRAASQPEAMAYTPTRRQRPPEAAASEPPPEAEEDVAGLDWVAVGLGFVAFIAVAGLIPLWLLVFDRYFH